MNNLPRCATAKVARGRGDFKLSYYEETPPIIENQKVSPTGGDLEGAKSNQQTLTYI